MSKQSRRPNRAARHDVPRVGGKRREPSARTRILLGILAAAGIVALFAAATLFGGDETPAASATSAPLAVGDAAPSFEGADVTTGRELSTESSLSGKNVLYYFSAGVGCQACMVQIDALEQHLEHLDDRSITLVSITNDDPETLASAASGYRITTPLVADESRELSARFGALALAAGMHGGGANHTFVLVDGEGTVRYVKDFPSMWVEPETLLEELPKV